MNGDWPLKFAAELNFALTKRKVASLAIALSVTTSGLTLLNPALVSSARADFSRPVDVVSVNWPGAAPMTTDVASVRKSLDDYTNPYWQSHAGITFSRGMDSVTPIQMSKPAPCNGDPTVTYMNDVAQTFYDSQGLSVGTRYLIILLPPIPDKCVWEAKSIVGDYRIPFGITVLQNNSIPYVITHELGHSLGLGHTDFMSCPTPGDSAWASCKNIEYGGAVDIMSNIETAGPLNVYHQWRLGELGDGSIQSISESGTFDLNGAGSNTGLRAVYIHDGSSVYWVEYLPAGYGFNAGLAVFRTDTPTNPSATVSPNTEYTGRYTGDSSGDAWLLNLGDYSYSNLPTGSPTGWSFATNSGNVTIAGEQIGDQANVTVSVKPGTNLLPLPATPTDLSKYTFATSDFGSNYQITPVQNGYSLTDPTMQICNGNYASEAHRLSRTQVAANPLYSSKYLFISSEAVQYESAFWANQALLELDSISAKCSAKVAVVKKLNYVSPSEVESRALLTTSVINKVQQNLIATFQVKGNILVGTYVLSSLTFSNLEVNQWLKLSQKIGIRL